jgi:chromate reductase, NAD(P)H dehydrogenase (quinone)
MLEIHARAEFEIAAVAGSLRQGSYNQALLHAAQQLAPVAMRIRIHDLSGIPLFSEDIERAGIPPAVASLREAVAEADGFLVATPEYNHGVPGVMKNAFDWLSRPPGKSVLTGKPSAIMGASPGVTGTARAQSQLRQSFVFTDTPVLPQPEVLVGRAHEKFDSAGRLTDDTTRKFLILFLEGFANWVGRLTERREMAVIS